MKHVVSLIGPTGVGKTTFAQWFIKRNPMYVHVDIAQLRLDFGVLDNGNINDTLYREDRLWQHVNEIVLANHYVLLESTGTSNRLQSIYYNAHSLYTVKFLTNRETLVRNILKRNNINMDLELIGLDDELAIIQNIKTNITVIDLRLNQYEQIENHILISLLETI